MQQIIKTRIQVGVGTVRIKIPKILLVCNFIVCYLYIPITQYTVFFNFAQVAELLKYFMSAVTVFYYDTQYVHAELWEEQTFTVPQIQSF